MEKGKLYNKMVETKGENKTVWLENTCSIALHGILPGAKVRVKCDKQGTPLDKHMRRRINDNDFVRIDKPVQKVEKKGGDK